MKFEKLQKVVLNILGRDQFETDANGHLVLSDEQKANINGSFKFAPDFAGNFVSAYNEQVDGKSQGEEVSALDAMNEAMKISVASQIKASKAEIEKELNAQFKLKLDAAKAELEKVNGEKAELENEKVELEAKVERLSNEDEDDTPEVVGDVKSTQMKQTAFKADMKLFHNQMAAEYIENGFSSKLDHAIVAGFVNAQMGGGVDDTIDVSQINQEFGIYLTGQRKVEIFRELLRPVGCRTYMTKKFGIERWRASQSQMTEIVQQFIAKWTPKGQAKFTPLEIINRRHKVNLPIVPDDITGGWLTYLYNEEVTPDQMPVVKYVIEVLLREQINDDIEYSMIATGAYEELGEVTEGDEGQAANKSMDGFVTILIAEKANVDTKVKFFTPDGYVFSRDNSVKFFEDYSDYVKKDPIGVKLHAKGMNVFTDPDMYEDYKKKYRDLYPMTKNEDKGSDVIEFSNLTLVKFENMRGTGVCFSTPKSNFIELHHRNEAGGATRLFLQLNNYEVRIFAEFWLAVGFAISEFVFAHVPEQGSGA